MSNMPPKPVGKPMYDLLADMEATVAFIKEEGGDVFDQAMKDEIRLAMDESGVRVVLWYAERMDDVTAYMEEFIP